MIFKTKKDKKIEELEEKVKTLENALDVIATEACDWSCVKYNYPEYEDEECPENCDGCWWHTPQKWKEWAIKYVTKK